MRDRDLSVNPQAYFIKLNGMGWVNLQDAAKSEFFFPYLKALDGEATVKTVTVNDLVVTSDSKIDMYLPETLSTKAAQLLGDLLCSSVIHGYTCIKVYPEPVSNFYAEICAAVTYRSGAVITLGVIRRNPFSEVEFHS